LEALPATIAALESEQASINNALADGNLFRDDLKRAKSMQIRLTEIDQLLESTLSRWEALESRQ
jgi:ATP-binding cassette subfamily F protein uup